ncbi:MAG TPA: hypothetical protein VLH15_06830, partial [Dehalococcoidales bacterium]|nr:hypothetical protein [Dehalococcoidales bacterium]
AWAVYALNRVNTGGKETPEAMNRWGQDKLRAFKTELRRLGRRNKVRTSQLYRPFLANQLQAGNRGPL